MSRRFDASRAVSLTLLILLLLLAASLLPNLRSSTEAVRLRNALLFDPAETSDFSWTPQAVPPSFAVDRSVPRTTLSDATTALLKDAGTTDWERSLRIASHLVEHARHGGPAKADLAGTYQTILEGGGYCADFTTVFIAMAASAGIFAREWAFSFDGYGGHGHALVEIFDRTTGQWRMLDVFNNFFPTDKATGRPLSVQEFRHHVAGNGTDVELQRIGPGRDGFRNHTELYRYYRAGIDQWYLWWGNAVYAYDASPASRLLGSTSRAGEQLLAIALGDHPRIRAVPSDSNASLRTRMVHLGWRLQASLVAGIALVALLVFQWVSGRRRSQRRDA